MTTTRILLLATSLLATPALASTTIVFSNGFNANWGSDAQVTAVNSSRTARGAAGVAVGPLVYWGNWYSNSEAAYAGDFNYALGEVALTPVSRPIRLVSVDFGGWPNSAISGSWFVYNNDYSTILASGSVTTNPTALTTVGINVSSASTLRFQFEGNWFLGIQNVVFSAVPEAQTWAMLIAGFGLVGGVARRRRLHTA